MNPKQFFEMIYEAAKPQSVVLYSILLSQSALETGFGLHAPHHNYFGIKSFGKKPAFQAKTTEYEGEKKIKITASFRRYAHLGESIQDYLSLMKKPRYKAVREAKSYQEAAHSLFVCGYATDPQYGPKLIAIIEEYALWRWDGPSLVNVEFEKAYDFVLERGISDGQRKKDFATREEVWTMIYRAMVEMRGK